MNLTGAITDDSYSNVRLALSIDNRTIHADSSSPTPPLLYSSLYITKIIQSLNLTDAITDDSYSNEHLVSSIDTIHADSFGQDCPPALISHVTQQFNCLGSSVAAIYGDSCKIPAYVYGWRRNDILDQRAM